MVLAFGDPLDVSNDMSSRIEQIKVEDPIDLGDNNVLSTLQGTVSSERRQCSKMAAARREASASPCGDASVKLHTISAMV